MLDPQPANGSGAKSQGVPKDDPIPGSPGVLVVDDDRWMRKALALWLREHGCRVWVAEHGGRAVELYRSLQEETDLVLMDVRMPGLDGPETLRILRAMNPGVRCCFLTAGDAGYTEEQLRCEGAVLVMAKPPDWAQIRSLLAGPLRRPAAPAPGPATRA
jgi:CheY-like chemotaxis protein